MNLFKSISLVGIITTCLLFTSCEKEEITDKSLDDVLNELKDEGQINDMPLTINTVTSTNVTPVAQNEITALLNKDQKSISDQILVLVNQYRSTKNLGPLIDNNTAKIEALNHSQYQVNLNDINHDNGSERSNILFNNENVTSYAENVAFGYRTAKAVVDGWIGSEGHRKNLEGDFTKSGIGTIANDQGVLYFTHILFK
ncbi:CAP domain-containing protein [Aquimarina agarilytica]|uniref:CAP domain-containing protein n=1 Tax=Aquimarina agarilytica TaxID=1087449 RepID=UPI00028947ED|nr:CAP domain-containing protein [Aquimarina agarilytica]